KHNIEVVVDRIIVKEGIEGRVADSIETALKLSDGLVIADIIDGEQILFSQKLSCPDCGVVIEELSPRMFSFNSPFGMCNTCNGIGHYKEIDPELVIPNPSLSIKEGGIAPFSTSAEDTYYYQVFKAIAEKNDFDIDEPLEKAPKEFLDELLYGTKDTIRFKFKSRYSGNRTYSGTFEGVIPNLERRYRETNSDYMRDKIDKYMAENPCPSCHGKRLKDEVLAVRINGLNIAEVTDLSIKDSLSFFENLKLTERQRLIGNQVLKEVKERLQFLQDVGLEYLTLSRSASTLSGGESQRIRLATQIGSS